MQDYFTDPTNAGKLYINYPMVESYEHLMSLPDTDYATRKVSVSVRPGSQYKALVKNTPISKLMNLPEKLDNALWHCYQIEPHRREAFVEALLLLHDSSTLQCDVRAILASALGGNDLKRAVYHISRILSNAEHVANGQPFWTYLRDVFNQIIIHNIRKAYVIQSGSINSGSKLVEQFAAIDERLIVRVQNRASQNALSGFIWVLNTSVFFVPEFNWALIHA